MKITSLFGDSPRRPARNITHSAECDARGAAAAAWAQRWPRHCPTCYGAGEVSYSDDPSAAGVSLSPGSMEFSDPCECVDAERCPRCAQSLLGPAWRHPRRRAAAWLRRSGPRMRKDLGFALCEVIAGVLMIARVDATMRERAMKRVAYRIVIGGVMSTAIYDLADVIASPTEDDATCSFCGWTGKADGDVMPQAECYCAEVAQYEHAQAAAAGSECWRCEQPFGPSNAGVQVKTIFGVRWMHPGCLFEDERIVD